MEYAWGEYDSIERQRTSVGGLGSTTHISL